MTTHVLTTIARACDMRDCLFIEGLLAPGGAPWSRDGCPDLLDEVEPPRFVRERELDAGRLRGIFHQGDEEAERVGPHAQAQVVLGLPLLRITHGAPVADVGRDRAPDAPARRS